MLTLKSLIEYVIVWGWSFNKNQTNTAQQDAKSNNATQDDEQHNAALRRRNHKKTQKRKLDICRNYLFRLKEKEKKMQRVILGQKIT